MAHTLPNPSLFSLPEPPKASQLYRLIDVMKRLRNPDNGCPWDIEQTHASLIPCLLEEAYEAVEAIEKKDDENLCEELGDVLLQVIFHAQIAEENGTFDIEKIAKIEADKMIERHPHVFGTREGVQTADDVIKNWENDKANKKANQTALFASSPHTAAPSALDGVHETMPALARATKLQSRAARVGFDWINPQDIFDKIKEESAELQAELDALTHNPQAIEEEFGDLFFVMVNLARRLKIDPEKALRQTNRKYERRFRAMEYHLSAQGQSMKDVSLEEKEAAWQAIKLKEKSA